MSDISNQVRAQVLREEASYLDDVGYAPRIGEVLRARGNLLDLPTPPKPDPADAKIGDVWGINGTLEGARICVEYDTSSSCRWLHFGSDVQYDESHYRSDDDLILLNYEPVDLDRYDYDVAVRAALGGGER